MKQMYFTICQAGRSLAGGSSGQKVRAATPGISHSVLQNAQRLADYPLPKIGGATALNPTTTSPRLSFQQLPEIGWVVSHVRYVGLDSSTNRAGNYFAHIVVPDASEEISAADVAASWKSSLWIVEDGDFSSDLPEINPFPWSDAPTGRDLLAGCNDPQNHLKELLPFALAHLMSSTNPPQIFLVGDGEAVILLVTMLGRILPARVCRKLSFSTYENQVGTCRGHIIGTWDPSVPDYDVPENLYQPGGTRVAFRVRGVPRSTPPPKTGPFIDFVLQAFETGSFAKMDEFRSALELAGLEDCHELEMAFDVWMNASAYNDERLRQALANDVHASLALRCQETVTRGLILFLGSSIHPDHNKAASIIHEKLQQEKAWEACRIALARRISEEMDREENGVLERLVNNLWAWLPPEHVWEIIRELKPVDEKSICLQARFHAGAEWVEVGGSMRSWMGTCAEDGTVKFFASVASGSQTRELLQNLCEWLKDYENHFEFADRCIAATLNRLDDRFEETTHLLLGDPATRSFLDKMTSGHTWGLLADRLLGSANAREWVDRYGEVWRRAERYCARNLPDHIQAWMEWDSHCQSNSLSVEQVARLFPLLPPSLIPQQMHVARVVVVNALRMAALPDPRWIVSICEVIISLEGGPEDTSPKRGFLEKIRFPRKASTTSSQQSSTAFLLNILDDLKSDQNGILPASLMLLVEVAANVLGINEIDEALVDNLRREMKKLATSNLPDLQCWQRRLHNLSWLLGGKKGPFGK